jgi:anti-sigma28 factor (negative regulator of flagellin synthesis)
MINKVLSSTIGSSYINNSTKNTNVKNNESISTKEKNQPGNETKIDKLKAAIESGNYKIDIEALAEKMAQELI